LPYDLPQKDEAIADLFIENRKRISISGVQEKLSLTLDKNRLRLTHAGESGTYILKPIPRDLKKVDQAPANEHLTMQIARQVYKINTAENGLVFFKDGSPAYLTRRFDIKPNGTRWGVEDFATLAGMTKANAGPNFKYPYSYEAIGPLMQRFMPAWKVEIEKYFTLVLFNYTFSNGDAHLKNFSVMEGPAGDYLFSPAYDLINTRIHIDDTDFALDKKLFEDNFRSAAWNKTAHASGDDFRELGRRIGVQEKRIETLMLPFLERQEAVENLIQRSFLNEASKRAYLLYYNTRRNYLMGR
jgi:serine/threonine-protein kinase HipA